MAEWNGKLAAGAAKRCIAVVLFLWWSVGQGRAGEREGLQNWRMSSFSSHREKKVAKVFWYS
jgi:hypothetical protein